MKFFFVPIFLVFVFLQFTGFVHGTIPASERAALIALYNSTNGDSWTNKTGWKTPPLYTDGFAMPGTEGGWLGVNVSGSSVISLSLNNNRLRGSIPSQLGNLNKLNALSLYNNQLSGSIPSQLGNLSNLTSLNLCSNQLSGSIPYQLGNLNNLQTLWLSSNQLSGSIPSQLGNLSNLVYLYLGDNQLNGCIPVELGNLSNLLHLGLGTNQLSGSIPSQLGNLNKLKEILLHENQLSGSIPSQLGNLGKLTSLNLCSNQLSGSIPSQLGNLNNLEVLYLHENQLNGSIPSQLGNLSNLKELLLDNNQLSGSIPSQLGNLNKLNVLLLWKNQLSGGIPSELGNLLNLETLLLFENQLSGSIPSQLGNLGKLTSLNLCSNQLSGSIPYKLGNLNNLQTLWLSSNQLSGSIPSQLGNLSNLVVFYLSSNQLSGSIPSSFTNLTKITSFDIGYNCLTATDINLRVWLSINDPDWETTQCLSVPEITTNSISSVTPNSAVCGGNITSDGGSPVTERGVCWSTVDNLTVNASRTTDGSGTGTYSSTITGLSVITKYYVRAYATSSVGTGYGSTVSFTTPSNLPEIDPPFGSFDTPVDGSTVAGSIPNTGWALDDGGLESVKIYLTQGDTQTYIGDALFVEGARPDVAAAYPDYPRNTKAGWGYMMLTNFLPGGGNGTFALSAIATDLVGKTTTLGTKTIIADNAYAVKPFGAIDTPTQGGTAMGSSYVNWGWALTPQSNSIATNGSTISVWVDGVAKGHPVYDIYRDDIAKFFPNYANSSGAVGYFNLDTTKYTDGVHAIFWIAADNGGNSDGIGSRYFTIQNSTSDSTQGLPTSTIEMNLEQIAALQENFSQPIKFSKGFNVDDEYQELLPDENGNSRIVIKELERVEIQLGENDADIQGYLISSNGLNKLPIGSTLDAKSGAFSWFSGPGFLGNYSLVFVLTDSNGQSFKKYIEIKIEPKFKRIQ